MTEDTEAAPPPEDIEAASPPDAEAPEAEAPEAEDPEAGEPEAEALEVEAPEADAPEAGEPTLAELIATVPPPEPVVADPARRIALRLEIMAAAERLTEAGIGSPRVDAEELAAHLLDVSRTRLGLHPLVDPEFVAAYRALVDRRAAREPLQHLTGRAFLGRTEVQVGPGVFVPRPETELLVDWALTAIGAIEAPVVVDLCSGSGAIALAIAQARPDARVAAVERAPGALAWARRNIELHTDAGGSPIDLRGGDITDERLLLDLEGTADLVVANPPYVPEGTAVEPEVGEHDPAEAVFAGPDGLALMRPLITVAATLLKVGGVLAIEHDDSQGESVPALLAGRRVLDDVAGHRDLNDRPRFATARRVPLRRETARSAFWLGENQSP